MWPDGLQNRYPARGISDRVLCRFSFLTLRVLPHPRLVIIEFSSRTATEDWYNSAEYRKIISLRLKSTVGNLFIVDGFAAP
jgi:hypothetical protein